MWTWATRKTANGKYVDDVIWTTNKGTSDNTCKVIAKSRSQSMSYYDYNVNFCNMYNPLRATGLYTGDIKAIKNSKCNYPATDSKTCDRY